VTAGLGHLDNASGGAQTTTSGEQLDRGKKQAACRGDVGVRKRPRVVGSALSVGSVGLVAASSAAPLDGSVDSGEDAVPYICDRDVVTVAEDSPEGSAEGAVEGAAEGGAWDSDRLAAALAAIISGGSAEGVARDAASDAAPSDDGGGAEAAALAFVSGRLLDPTWYINRHIKHLLQVQ